MVSVDLDFQIHGAVNSSCLQIGSLGDEHDEHIPKVRKPYTITKQRERWTEEEHNKFLEALQLYGRAWRRIEEHIGSKNAVQIRSHAQKFFTKVVRQSVNSDCVGSSKGIEIPPPRPKRKPMHPYPRKLGNSPGKSATMLKPLIKPLPKILSPSETENGSPTSVLSTVGSEILASVASADQRNSLSPVVSATASSEIDNGGQSPEESTTLVSGRALGSLVAEEQQNMNMELDELPSEKMASEVASSTELRVPTFKLFGKVLTVTEPEYQSPSCCSNSALNAKATSLTDNEEHSHGKIAISKSNPVKLTLQTSNDRGITRDIAMSSRNSSSDQEIPILYYFLSGHDNSKDSIHVPQPWWTVYGGSLQGADFGQHPMKSATETVCDEEMQGEGSWSDSNNTSVSGVGISDQNADDVDSVKALSPSETQLASPSSRLQPSQTSAFKSWKSNSNIHSRGFKPYKTCSNGSGELALTVVA